MFTPSVCVLSSILKLWGVQCAASDLRCWIGIFSSVLRLFDSIQASAARGFVAWSCWDLLGSFCEATGNSSRVVVCFSISFFFLAVCRWSNLGGFCCTWFIVNKRVWGWVLLIVSSVRNLYYLNCSGSFKIEKKEKKNWL